MTNDALIARDASAALTRLPVPGSAPHGVDGKDTGVTRKEPLHSSAGAQGVEHADRRIETPRLIDVPSELNGQASQKDLSAKGAG